MSTLHNLWLGLLLSGCASTNYGDVPPHRCTGASAQPLPDDMEEPPVDLETFTGGVLEPLVEGGPSMPAVPVTLLDLEWSTAWQLNLPSPVPGCPGRSSLVRMLDATAIIEGVAYERPGGGAVVWPLNGEPHYVHFTTELDDDFMTQRFIDYFLEEKGRVIDTLELGVGFRFGEVPMTYGYEVSYSGPETTPRSIGFRGTTRATSVVAP